MGKPLPTTQIHILDDDGNELGPNETGRVYLRSLIGTDFEFLGDTDKTDSVHEEPGVFTYGDIGHLDNEGFLHLSDGDIGMIISGGVNIYPAEIEAVAMTRPAVAESPSSASRTTSSAKRSRPRHRRGMTCRWTLPTSTSSRDGPGVDRSAGLGHRSGRGHRDTSVRGQFVFARLF